MNQKTINGNEIDPLLKLEHFINKFSVGKVGGYSHVKLRGVDYGGSYIINDENLDEFYELYSICVQHKKILVYAEYPTEKSKLYLDFDFHLKKKNTLPSIGKKISNFASDQELTVCILNEIGNVLFDIYKLDKLDFYVFYKCDPVKEANEFLKDGLHVYVTNVIMDKNEKLYFRNKLINALKSTKIMTDFEHTNTIEDIVDKSVLTSNGAMMFRSSKPGGRPYKFYNHKLSYVGKNKQLIATKINMGFPSTIPNLVKTLSLRKVLVDKMEYINDEIKQDITVFSKTTPSNKKKVNKIIKEKENEIMHPDIYYNRESKDSIINIVENLVKLLNKNRFNDYDSWMRIGYILKSTVFQYQHLNIMENDMFEIWNKYSFEYCPKKYDHNSCVTTWNNLDKIGKDSNKKWPYTIGSLFYYAKTDNPVEYEKLKNTGISNQIIDMIQIREYDISEIISPIFINKYICIDTVKKSVYYCGNDNSWYLDKNSNSIYEWFTKHITLIIDEAINTNYKLQEGIVDLNENEQIDDKDKKLKLDKYKKQLNKLLNAREKVGTKTFIDHTWSFILNKIFDKNNRFQRKLDVNCNIISFNNGVYELGKGFRKRKLTDYTTLSTGYDYIEYENINQEYIKTFLKWIDDLIYNKDETTRKDEIKYLINHLSKLIWGNRNEEKMFIWIGEGRNGKSVLLNFIQQLLGDYHYKIPNSALVNVKRGGNDANPVLSGVKGKRFVELSEPKGSDELIDTDIKEWCSVDLVTARHLYENQQTFRPTHTMHYISNNIPVINAVDEGTWRRIEILKFRRIFPEEGTDLYMQYYDEKEQKFSPTPNIILADRDFKQIFDNIEFIQSVMSYLIHYFENNHSNIIYYVPKTMIKTQNKFRQNSNTIYNFITKCIRRLATGSMLANSAKPISLENLFSTYETYTRSRSTPVNREVFNNYCKRHFTSKFVKDGVLRGHEIIMDSVQ